MKMKTEKSETESWFFVKTDEIDKPLGRLTKIKREKTEITKIKNDIGDTSTEPTTIKRMK